MVDKTPSPAKKRLTDGRRGGECRGKDLSLLLRPVDRARFTRARKKEPKKRNAKGFSS